MRVFITGTAGFIGFHLARLLLQEGHSVHGFDGLTNYYDVRLKRRRHALLREHPAFTATEALLEDADALQQAAAGHGAVQVHPRHSRRHAHRHLQPRPDGARLHLRLVCKKR